MDYQEIHQQYLKEIQRYLDDKSIDKVACFSACQTSKKHFLKSIEYGKSQDFEDQEAELHFLRDTQLLPYSHWFYFTSVLRYLNKRPVLDTATQRAYLKKSMRRVNKFFKRHADFSAYLELQTDHPSVDHICKQDPQVDLTSALLFDTSSIPSYCQLYGQHLGYQLFAQYLKAEESALLATKGVVRKKPLQWTGQKVDLIELVYALFASGVFNHGNATLRSIAEYLQTEFGCPLGDIYRSYSELRYRKKSRTKFLDQLVRKLSDKMELDDG